jgi:hypothetical protein
MFVIFNIFWHVDPLLDNDRETKHSNRGTVFSMLSVPRCYKQGSQRGVFGQSVGRELL